MPQLIQECRQERCQCLLRPEREDRNVLDIALLRVRRERPGRRAAEQRDELAALHHSITSSAMASTPGGMVRPRVLAVLRLMTSSNLVGCSTGISAGFSPLSI